jgi:hypothetical protein
MNSLLVVYNALPSILSGSLVTVGNVTLSLTMGLLLGVPMAVAQVYGALASAAGGVVCLVFQRCAHFGAAVPLLRPVHQHRYFH